MKKYSFKAIVNGKTLFPKGFYYQNNDVILIGCEKSGHTIRQKLKIKDVELVITEN